MKIAKSCQPISGPFFKCFVSFIAEVVAPVARCALTKKRFTVFLAGRPAATYLLKGPGGTAVSQDAFAAFHTEKPKNAVQRSLRLRAQIFIPQCQVSRWMRYSECTSLADKVGPNISELFNVIVHGHIVEVFRTDSQIMKPTRHRTVTTVTNNLDHLCSREHL